MKISNELIEIEKLEYDYFKGKSFRYEYKNSPFFITLSEKPYRVKFLYRDGSITEEQILGFKTK